MDVSVTTGTGMEQRRLAGVLKYVAFAIVAIGSLASTALVLSGLRPFVRSDPESFDPTLLYAALLLVVCVALVIHAAVTETYLDHAGWFVVIAVVAGIPAVVFTVLTIGLVFVIGATDLWTPLLFLLALLVTAGPSLAVGINSIYLLDGDETTPRRRVTTVAVTVTLVSALQLALLFVTRNG